MLIDSILYQVGYQLYLFELRDSVLAGVKKILECNSTKNRSTFEELFQTNIVLRGIRKKLEDRHMEIELRDSGISSKTSTISNPMVTNTIIV